ncbi:sporulation protein YtxC [Bacillus sp. B-jedd]|uniref:sporulation protein YtxC n=1 Tax=Bacillus sp. B-jedd TaxID=1476857 RepID=UPI0005156044|nr:sporulation protein YtxC [Bacillus sp. B-jedd]CEG28163.1 Sporulation protein YtxC [Bacillus sp. B-jedd]
MAEIIFQKKADGWHFSRHLNSKWEKSAVEKIFLLEEEKDSVKIKFRSLSGEVVDKVKQAFWEFISHVKWDEWFRDVLCHTYFFQDTEEQQQITDMMHSIMEGSRRGLSPLPGPGELEERIKDSLGQMLRPGKTFSFDSFCKFRLRSLFERLEALAAMSIDEYKLEQEYQMFIESLRGFLRGREAKMERLHVLAGEAITFFDDNMEEVKRVELAKMIDRKLLINHPVYVDSYSIAPLLSISPAVIYLYTDNPEDPLIRTIKNIFEERVEFCQIKDFPREF